MSNIKPKPEMTMTLERRNVLCDEFIAKERAGMLALGGTLIFTSECLLRHAYLTALDAGYDEGYKDGKVGQMARVQYALGFSEPHDGT